METTCVLYGMETPGVARPWVQVGCKCQGNELINCFIIKNLTLLSVSSSARLSPWQQIATYIAGLSVLMIKNSVNCFFNVVINNH